MATNGSGGSLSQMAVYVMAVALIGFTLFLSPCKADPALVGPVTSRVDVPVWMILLIGFSATVFIEHILIFIIVRCPLNANWALLRSVVVINLITFPITQVLALACAYYFDMWQTYLLVDAFPFVAEYLLFKWQFGRLYLHGILARPVPNSRVLTATMSANLATFILGNMAASELFISML